MIRWRCPGRLRPDGRAVRDAVRLGGAGTRAALVSEYGAERIGAVLGDGVKRLAPAERGQLRRTNRSLHAVRAIRRASR
jgi:sialic acid synthase SpsE